MTSESPNMGHDKDKSASVPPRPVDEPDLFANPPSLLDDLETFPEPATDTEELASDDAPLAANDGAYATTPADDTPVEPDPAPVIAAESTTAATTEITAADSATPPTDAAVPEMPASEISASETPEATQSEAQSDALSETPEAPPAEALTAPSVTTDAVTSDSTVALATQEGTATVQQPVTPPVVLDTSAEQPEVAVEDADNNTVVIAATPPTTEKSQTPVQEPAPSSPVAPGEPTIDASVFDDHPAKFTGMVPVPRAPVTWATHAAPPAEPTIDASIFDDDLLPHHTTITFPGSAPRYRSDAPPPPEKPDAPLASPPEAFAPLAPVGDEAKSPPPVAVQPPPALVVTERLTPRPEAALSADSPADLTPDVEDIADTDTSHDDKTFFFEDGVRRQRLDLLMHFCMRWHEILALTSPVNNGKTTFINYLAEHVADTQAVSIIKVTPRMNVDAFIATAYRTIVRAPEAIADLDRNKLVMRIRDFLQQRYRRGLPPLLILDDAHHLNPELLNALHAMTYLTQPLDALGANLIFVGSEAMLPQVNGVFIQHRVKILDLPRLTELSARRFILARLTAAGFKNPETVFTQRQTSKLLRQTQCRIGHLEDLIRHKLRSRPEFKKIRTPKTWTSRAVKILLLLPLAGAGIVYQNEIQRFYSTHAQRLGTIVYLALPALERSLGLDSATETAAPIGESTESADTSEASPAETAKTEESSPFDDETLFVQPAKSDDTAAPNGTTTEAAANAHTDTPPAATPVTDVAPLNRQHLWLTLQNPSHLTLQIYGTTDELSARQLISQYKLQGTAYYFASRLQGYLWFSVIYGSYTDEATAKAHVQEVPESLRSFAKIRSFKDMQALLLEGQTTDPGPPAKATDTINK